MNSDFLLQRVSRSGLFFTALVFAAITSVAFSPTIDTADAASHIRGLITDDAGQPLADALVQASYRGSEMPDGTMPPDREAEAEARTGRDGRYDLELEFPGCYVLRVSAFGHQSDFYPGQQHPGNIECVAVRADTRVDGIDLRLRRAGAITGLITDARTGAPLEGAYVFAQPAWSYPPDGDGNDDDSDGDGENDDDDPSGGGGGGGGHPGDPDDPNGHGWTWPTDYWVDGTAITDASGRYEIQGLGAGEYFVYAQSEGHLGAFYGTAQIPDEPTRVTVAPPQTIAGIDIALGRGGCIIGRVTDAQGAPIEGATVSLGGPVWADGSHGPGHDGVPPHGETSPPEPGSGGVTGPDGTYSLCGLAPGDYNVWVYAEGFLPEFYPDAACWEDAQFVTVPGDGDVSSIDLVLSRGGRIEGRVGGEGATSEGAWVHAWPMFDESEDDDDPNGHDDPNGPMRCWGRGGGSGVVDADGAYVIEGLASGRYLVVAEAPEFLRTFYGGGQDPQSAQAVEVTAPDATRAIDIQLERGGSISGKLLDAETGAPLQGWVELYLPGMEGGSDPTDGIRSRGARTDEFGVYRITGIPSGEYLVMANSREHRYEPEFYPDARTPEEATPVRVEAPAETAEIDFALGRSRPSEGAIVGRVLALESDAPVAGAVVTAISLAGHAGFDVADDDGFYSIASLPPGEYLVLGAALGRIGAFYENALSWEDAKPVAVLGPIFGIDLRLPAQGEGNGMISGRVVDGDGQSVAQAWVYAEPEDGTAASGFTTSGQDGHYVLSNLAPGRYHIRATRAGMSDSYHAEESGGPAAPILVDRGTVEDVNVVLGGGSVPGVSAPLLAERTVPNPFRDAATIRLVVDRPGVSIAVDVFDMNGRHVRALSARSQSAGRQELHWNGRDQAGELVPSGVYVYRASVTGNGRSGREVSGRLVLLR